MQSRQYFTYILTNWECTVLYTGVTNNLTRRLIEHWVGKEGSFTTMYKVYYLLWYESSPYILNAISREKEIKALLRSKKDELVKAFNPTLRFLNEDFLGHWPPTLAELAELKEYLRRNPGEFER